MLLSDNSFSIFFRSMLAIVVPASRYLVALFVVFYVFAMLGACPAPPFRLPPHATGGCACW